MQNALSTGRGMERKELSFASHYANNGSASLV